MTLFTVPPVIEKNPNENVPLVALVKFSTTDPVTTKLTIADGRKIWTITYGLDYHPTVGLPVIGMRADTEHQIIVEAGDLPAVTLSYKTPPLPGDSAEWPTIDVKTANSSEMEPGYTLLSVRRRVNQRQQFMTPAQVQFTVRWGMLLILDEEGVCVWYYISFQ